MNKSTRFFYLKVSQVNVQERNSLKRNFGYLLLYFVGQPMHFSLLCELNRYKQRTVVHERFAMDETSAKVRDMRFGGESA